MFMEIWKKIKGYEDYQVSNLGSVKSFKKGKEKILKQKYNKDGYLCLGITANNYQKQFLVHRLVAFEFIDNLEKKETVNHKNGIKTDNRVENLEWNTRSENIRHADKTGLRKMLNGTKCHKAVLTEKDVLFIRESHLKQKDLAIMFNINPSAISNIITRKNWKHL